MFCLVNQAFKGRDSFKLAIVSVWALISHIHNVRIAACHKIDVSACYHFNWISGFH